MVIPSLTLTPFKRQQSLVSVSPAAVCLHGKGFLCMLSAGKVCNPDDTQFLVKPHTRIASASLPQPPFANIYVKTLEAALQPARESICQPLDQQVKASR